jgi:hypothetical protein
MRSSIAIIALALWPFVAIWLFATRPAIPATLWTIIGAQLLLPVGEAIKFPILPPLDKASIPNICIFVGYFFFQRSIWRPKLGLAEVLLSLYLVGPIVTSLLNGDPVVFRDAIIPGVGIYDAGSTIAFGLFTLMPFFVGRGLLRTLAANEQTLYALAVAGLIYSIPMLFEIRFSPQLHAWVYGYYPTDFIQQMRDGGFRPMVFMGHGLIAATFLFMATAAAAALWRANIQIGRLSSGLASAFLSGVLFLCRSFGALVFMAFILPMICFVRPRMQSYIAIVLVLIALCYPMLRFADLIPTSQILELVGNLSLERAASLRVRFDNEEILLNRALERPVFGWGRYGRSRVHNEDGKDVSTTDGRWIITIGQFGIVGFVAEFGLLAFAVMRGAAAASGLAAGRREKVLLASLALIVSANVVDLLPNSSLLPVTWLFAGSLLGRAEVLRKSHLSKPRPVQETASNVDRLAMGESSSNRAR